MRKFRLNWKKQSSQCKKNNANETKLRPKFRYIHCIAVLFTVCVWFFRKLRAVIKLLFAIIFYGFCCSNYLVFYEIASWYSHIIEVLILALKVLLINSCFWLFLWNIIWHLGWFWLDNETGHKNIFGLSVVLELMVENSTILTFKVIFYVKNWRDLSDFFFHWSYIIYKS